jgi:outer membrane protein TolC
MEFINKKYRSVLVFVVMLLALSPIHGQDTLQLSTAIQIGIENNLNIQISEGQKQISVNNNTLGNAGFLPTMDAAASQRYRVEDTELMFFTGSERIAEDAKSNNTATSALINWTLFDGTTMFYTKDRLETQEKQAFALNDAVIQNTVASIGAEFYTVALEQIRLRLFGENISLSEERLEIAKNKFEFGKVAKMEYLQAQVDLNNDKSNYLIQEQRLAAAKAVLNELLARDVTTEFYADFDPQLNTTLDFETLKSSMERGNPQLAASRYQMSVAMLEQKEIRGERLPSIGVNAGYSYSRSEAQAGNFLYSKSSGYNYGLTANWQLFNGFNLNRRMQNAKIVTENSSINYEALKLNLERGLYEVYLSYKNNIELHGLEQANLAVAQENNDIAVERYKVGNSSPLELREAQINLLEANLRLLNAAYSVKVGEIDLLLISGQLMKE